MTSINRNHAASAVNRYDVIIIGGGIYGAALALTASQMGLTNLLVEKNDFGGATSYNHLRTVHGGLRYLQTLDIPRFIESVSERHWFMKEFPYLTKPLPCLMPLYGNGPYRPTVFRLALALNDTLSRNRNKDVQPGQELQNGRVISPEQVIGHFPLVDRNGLKGGAVWYDGGMPSPQLVIMEMIKKSCKGLTTALNYTEAKKLLVSEQITRGVRCRDNETGNTYEFFSDKVINATGPWCRTFAASFHDDDPKLFRYSIAWNVLFNRQALSDHSVAVKPKRPGSRMYFIHGFNNLIMGGTIHAPWSDVSVTPMPEFHEVAAYLDDLNLSVPGLHLTPRDILQVFAGLLPVQLQGTDKLAAREVIKDHGAKGGPQGVYSVSGVKFTTARLVAEKVFSLIFPDRAAIKEKRETVDANEKIGLFPYDWKPDHSDTGWKENLRWFIEHQSAVHLDDLLLRRTTLGDNQFRALDIASEVAELFGWDESRRAAEIRRVKSFYETRRFPLQSA